MASTLQIGTDDLTPRAVWRTAGAIAYGAHQISPVSLSSDSRLKINAAARVVEKTCESRLPVYGLNTGVGALRNCIIEGANLHRLQENLLRSHACGVGDPLGRATVAAMWIHLLASAANGHRGIRLSTIDSILSLLNRGVLAQVPSKGSVGASGDLAPAAHAALLLIGEGTCTMPMDGEIKVLSAKDALRSLNLSPVVLGPKEALSLINGTHLTTAYACQVWTEAEVLWRTATLALAMSTIGFRANPTLSRIEVFELHHPATVYAGLQKQQWFEGSPLSSRNHDQDPYCFRCAPQVHGAIWKEIEQCEEWVTEELAATTDNPMILAETSEFIHGGNFHAIYPARMLDRLASAMTQLASISERRINLGMDSKKTGLPAFLSPQSGLNSGLMMAQTTAAALVSECKALSFPASVDSIPTNCDQEDHVSMGPIAGWKAVQICRNVRDVLAIEILAAYQAIHLRGGAEILPPRLRRIFSILNDQISPIEHDRVFSLDIQSISQLIANEVFISEMEGLLGAASPSPAQVKEI